MPIVAPKTPPVQALRGVAEVNPGINTASALLAGADGGLCLGLPDLDQVLGGGLARGAVHEIASSSTLNFGAAAGFAVALLARAAAGTKDVLWIQTDFAEMETGAPHGVGLDLFGFESGRLLLLRVRRALDALWATEEALKSRALAAVLTELTADSVADLTVTRRLTLAAREGGGLGLLLHHTPSLYPSTAMTRWDVASAPGMRDRYGGLGRTTFALSLVRNRRGPTGRWITSWDHHERVFISPTLSLAVAAAPSDRPDRAPLVHAG